MKGPIKKRKAPKNVGRSATTTGRKETATPISIPKHKPQWTYALGEVKDAPGAREKAGKCPFTMRKRMPAWFPDGEVVKTKSGYDSCRVLFLEETIGKKKNTFLQSLQVPFGAKPEDSKKWALGSKLVKLEDAPGEDYGLTDRIRKLATLARTYNAALYDLRRVHFYWDYKDEPKVAWPPPNPHGKLRDIPDTSNVNTFRNKWARPAEEEWKNACDKLTDFLDTPKLHADMVTVNGYIISMRVVVEKDAQEVGGSSSHISLSSAFSSPSP